jgi:hypothetical protein
LGASALAQKKGRPKAAVEILAPRVGLEPTTKRLTFRLICLPLGFGIRLWISLASGTCPTKMFRKEYFVQRFLFKAKMQWHRKTPSRQRRLNFANRGGCCGHR